MRIRQWLIVVTIVASVGGCRRASNASASAPPPPSIDGGAMKIQFYRNPSRTPDLTLRDLDGRLMSSADWRGKVTLINFWATWCPPCRAEIPDLIKLQDKYKDQLQIIGISEDDVPAEVVKAFVTTHKMNYRVAMTNPDVEKAFPGVAALPTTFVIDREGRIVQRHVGRLTSGLTELETRALAGLPVNVPVEEVDRGQPMKIDNAAQLKSIPGIDLASLPPDKRAAALQKLNSDGCTCGCDLTLARCRVEDPSCGVSLPLAKRVVEAIAASHP